MASSWQQLRACIHDPQTSFCLFNTDIIIPSLDSLSITQDKDIWCVRPSRPCTLIKGGGSNEIVRIPSNYTTVRFHNLNFVGNTTTMEVSGNQCIFSTGHYQTITLENSTIMKFTRNSGFLQSDGVGIRVTGINNELILDNTHFVYVDINMILSSSTHLIEH